MATIKDALDMSEGPFAPLPKRRDLIHHLTAAAKHTPEGSGAPMHLGELTRHPEVPRRPTRKVARNDMLRAYCDGAHVFATDGHRVHRMPAADNLVRQKIKKIDK